MLLKIILGWILSYEKTDEQIQILILSHNTIKVYLNYTTVTTCFSSCLWPVMIISIVNIIVVLPLFRSAITSCNVVEGTCINWWFISGSNRWHCEKCVASYQNYTSRFRNGKLNVKTMNCEMWMWLINTHTNISTKMLIILIIIIP